MRKSKSGTRETAKSPKTGQHVVTFHPRLKNCQLVDKRTGAHEDSYAAHDEQDHYDMDLSEFAG